MSQTPMQIVEAHAADQEPLVDRGQCDSWSNGVAVGTPIRILCRRLDTTPRTLRLYEELGLVSPRRDRRGARVYDADDVSRLTLIIALRQLNYGLAEIAQLVGLSRADRDRALLEKLSSLCRRRAEEVAYLERVVDSLRRGEGVALSLADYLNRP